MSNNLQPNTLKAIAAILETDPAAQTPGTVAAILGTINSGRRAPATRYYTETETAKRLGVSKVFLWECRQGSAHFYRNQPFPFRTLKSPAGRTLYLADEVDQYLKQLQEQTA